MKHFVKSKRRNQLLELVPCFPILQCWPTYTVTTPAQSSPLSSSKDNSALAWDQSSFTSRRPSLSILISVPSGRSYVLIFFSFLFFVHLNTNRIDPFFIHPDFKEPGAEKNDIFVGFIFGLWRQQDKVVLCAVSLGYPRMPLGHLATLCEMTLEC